MKLARATLPVAVVLALTSAASAQQAGLSARQVVEQIAATYAANFNKHDAAAIAGLYTSDGVLVSPNGAINSGTQAIIQNYESLFKLGLDHVEFPIGQAAQLTDDVIVSWGNEYHVTGQGKNGPLKLDGSWTATYLHQAGAWKLRLVTTVPKPPPAAK